MRVKSLTKYALAAAAAAVVLPGFIILNVGLLGTAAAYLAAFFGPGGPLSADYGQAAWYFRNPASAAWAWLTRPGDELSHPEVRAWWLGLNAAIGVTIFAVYLRVKIGRWGTGGGVAMRSEDKTHGSARWAKRNDLARVCDFGFGPGTMLAAVKGPLGLVPVRIPQKHKTWMNNHVLVVGAPGSGKSRGYVRPNIFAAVRTAESFVATDPKGELFRDMAGWLTSKGYVVKALNLRPADMHLSDSWNPAGEIRTTLDADVFAQVVISTTEIGSVKGEDSFWTRAEVNLLKALALYATHGAAGDLRPGTMAQIYDLLASGDHVALDRLFAKLPASHPAKGPYNVYAMAGENLRGGVVIGLGTRLSVFQQNAVRRVTDTSEIDLALPGIKKCAYFVVTPDTQDAFNFLASLFFTFLFVRLVEMADANVSGRLAVPVRLLLDEFANIVSISQFEKKIATARSRGITCHVIIQGLPQLERKYGRAWQEIKACCDTTVVLGVKDDYTARYISSMLGRCTVETHSRSRDVTSLSSALFDNRESRGATGRELMTPDELQRLPSKFCLVFLPAGTPPAKLHVVDYTEFPEAGELRQGGVDGRKQITANPKDLPAVEKLRDVVVGAGGCADGGVDAHPDAVCPERPVATERQMLDRGPRKEAAEPEEAVADGDVEPASPPWKPPPSVPFPPGGFAIFGLYFLSGGVA
jgi:type IV secretion system protein VirD4